MSEQTSVNFGVTSTSGGATAPTSTTPIPNGDSDPVTMLVGEGKKFKTVQDLARGKVEADAFVEQLKTENKTLRAALDKGEDTTGIQAKIDQLLAQTKGNGTADPKVNQTNPESLTSKEVLDLLDRRERDMKMLENSARFNDIVTKALGDKAKVTIDTRLTELGMDTQIFNQMVATSPKSALALVGIKEAPMASAASNASATNTAAVFANANDVGKKNFAYYDKLRRELKGNFYTPAIQKEMTEQALKLGEDFYV
jgi:hypothetical protein